MNAEMFSIGNNLLIVDTLNLAFRFKHANYKVDNAITMPEWATFDDVVDLIREELSDAYFFEEFLNTILSIARSYKAKKIVCCADLKGSHWRKAIYPEYKADRDEKYKDMPWLEQAAGLVFLEHYNNLLQDLEKCDEVELIVKEGVEADDLASFVVSEASKHNYKDIWLVSTDQDWDLLLSDNVHRFNWMTKSTWKNVTKTGPRPKEVTLDNWSEHYEYPFFRHLDIKVLVGGEDNINGIAGVGPKRALALLDKYGDINGIIAALPIKGTAAYVKALNAGADYLKMAQKLMDLGSYNDEILPVDIQRRISSIIAT